MVCRVRGGIFSLLLLFGVDIEPPITKYTVNVFSRSVIFDISKPRLT